MEAILNICKNEYFSLGLLILNILLILIFFISTKALNKSKKAYKTLIKKLGKANNIEELLCNYLQKVEQVETNNENIKIYCENINKELNKCIQKVGIVRYSAFKDVGSDLSFALALLDEENSGIVLNGIYSVENSNIYAKPIEKGKSKYTISEEEQKAIDKAIQN